MHRFMRAIGFSKLTERKQQKKLVTDIIVNPDDREYTTKQNDTVITMFSKEFAPGLGISVCGEFDEDDNYSYDYFYPYLRGNVISSSEDVSISSVVRCSMASSSPVLAAFIHFARAADCLLILLRSLSSFSIGNTIIPCTDNPDKDNVVPRTGSNS